MFQGIGKFTKLQKLKNHHQLYNILFKTICKNNSSTTPVNKTNLIPNVNYLSVNTTELNELAVNRKRLSDSYPSHFSQVDTDAGDKNYLKIGGIAAVAGILAVIAIKR